MSSRPLLGQNLLQYLGPFLSDHALHRNYRVNILSCVKRSKLIIFSLEQQGQVIDHALKCEKNITWIPTTRHVEKLSFYTLNL